MPVCKKCHNYVTGKLEPGHPCPHCGNEDTINDRQEGDYKSIFSSEIDNNYSGDYESNYNSNYGNNQPNYNSNNNYSQNNASVRLYNNLPLEFLFPYGVSQSTLPVTEQKVYLQLSLEYLIIMNKAPNFQDGQRNWFTVLPERLQFYGLSRDVWDRISHDGDRDLKLQEELKKLMKKIF